MSENEMPAISGVSMCVVKGDKVLLAKRGNQIGYGLWSFPGGHVQDGEPLRDAALRELAEETGVNAEIVKLLDTIDIVHRDASGEMEAHFVLSVFLGQWISGEAVANSDASDVKWVTEADAAALKTTPGTTELVAASIRQFT
jgi:ADP-ribose pyrophosphatase YjhB (NUDIX family)